MPNPRLILAWILIMLHFSCKVKQDLPEKFNGNQIHFGQGGGFTGVVNAYALLDNGKLFSRTSPDTTFHYMTTWDENFVSQIFENYKLLHLDQLNHYEPGNLFYFIEYYHHDRVHRIAWGKPDARPPDNVISFYNLLYKSTKSPS